MGFGPDVSRVEIGPDGPGTAASLAAALHAGSPEPSRPRIAVITEGEGAPSFVDGIDPGERALACAAAVHAVATAVLSGTVSVSVLGRCLGAWNGLAMSADVVSLRSGTSYDMSAASLTPGAYATLARRVGSARLNRLLLSDAPVAAEDLHAAGIADFLHSGETATEASALVARMRRRSNGEAATYLARERAVPLDIARVRACAELAVGARAA